MPKDKQHKIPNAPTLRFPEFSGEWEENNLQEIASFSKGTGISKDQLSYDGEPCILYGELYTKYNSEVINEIVSKTNIDATNLIRSQANDVIIPSSGETAIDISTARCVPYDDVLLGGDLNVIRLHSGDGRFFCYQLNGVRKKDIASIAQGVSVVHLYGESLRKLSVHYPPVAEQQKIADFLAQIDERIQTQIGAIDKLESLIKSLAYKLTICKDVISIADCVDCHSSTMQEKDVLEEGKYPVYGASGICGYTDTPMCNEPAILIVKDGSGVGSISFADGGFSILGTMNYLTAKNDTNIKYIYCCLLNFDFTPYKTGMAIPHIYFKDYGKGRIGNMKEDEQSKVADLIFTLRDKRSNEHSLLTAYRQQKTYLLSQMFV